jgi:hypothetical protein
MPYYRPYGPMCGTPPMVPPPNYNYGQKGNQALSASQGKQKTPAPLKNSALSESKKRKVAEVASGSRPKQVQQLLSVVLIRLASKILPPRLCNCRLPTGLSLLPGSLGRLSFIKLPWIDFVEVWSTITGTPAKTSKKAV